MKIIQFKCNICGSIWNFKDGQNSLKAIYFTGNIKFDIRPVSAECDTHICNSCLEQLQAVK